MATGLPSTCHDAMLAWVFFSELCSFLQKKYCSLQKQKHSWILRCFCTMWSQSWTWVHPYDWVKAFSKLLSSSGIPPKRSILNCSISSLPLFKLINGCYNIIYMVVHEALRSLVLGFNRTWYFFLIYFNTQSPSIFQSLEESEFRMMNAILQEAPVLLVEEERKGNFRHCQTWKI